MDLNAPFDDYQHASSEELLATAAQACAPEREALMTEVVTRHLPLAGSLAGRFRHTSEDMADLVQVARLGLVLAAHRYDPDSGVPFTAFATPTILGELKRHLRDYGWAVRPPRRLVDLRGPAVRAQDELTVELGRPPTVNEVADRCQCPVGDAVEALTLTTAFRPVSLDAPLTGGAGALAETLQAPDARMDEVDDRLTLRAGVATLPSQTREVLRLRYVQESTQSQIAQQIGVSQMQVSRIITRAVDSLRPQLAQHG